jgi:hypothetical protein
VKRFGFAARTSALLPAGLHRQDPEKKKRKNFNLLQGAGG